MASIDLKEAYYSVPIAIEHHNMSVFQMGWHFAAERLLNY